MTKSSFFFEKGDFLNNFFEKKNLLQKKNPGVFFFFIKI